MQHQFVIVIDDKVSQDFAIDFLKNVTFIKSVKPKKLKRDPEKSRKGLDEVTLMSEKALAEDWLSEEDSRWDKVL